jgi:hypothetical protein
MTLPDVCPLDSSQKCKGRECHLFCVEWRTNDPICEIGYSSTSKVNSGRASRKQDTYAAETFQKLNKKQEPALTSRITRSEKGDWIPSHMASSPARPEGPALRKEEKPFRGPGGTAHEEGYAGKPEGRYQESSRKNLNLAERLESDPHEAERASLRLESRLKREEAEEAERALEVKKVRETEKIRETESLPPKPKLQERVIARNRNATIIEACDGAEEPCTCSPGRGEGLRKSADLKEKRKKLDDVMDIDLPDNYEEEFWS